MRNFVIYLCFVFLLLRSGNGQDEDGDWPEFDEDDYDTDGDQVQKFPEAVEESLSSEDEHHHGAEVEEHHGAETDLDDNTKTVISETIDNHSLNHHSHNHNVHNTIRELILGEVSSEEVGYENETATIKPADTGVQIELYVHQHQPVNVTSGVEVINLTPHSEILHSMSEDPDSDPWSVEMGQDEGSYEEISEESYAGLFASLQSDEVLTPTNGSDALEAEAEQNHLPVANNHLNSDELRESEIKTEDSNDTIETEEIEVDNGAESVAKQNDTVSESSSANAEVIIQDPVTEDHIYRRNDTNRNIVPEDSVNKMTLLPIRDYETERPENNYEVQEQDSRPRSTIIYRNDAMSFGTNTDPSSNLMFITVFGTIAYLNS